MCVRIKVNPIIAGSCFALACIWTDGAFAYDTKAFSDPHAYLEKSFVVSSIPAKLLKPLPPLPAPKASVREMRFTLEQTRIGKGDKKQVIEFDEEVTFLGNGIVRSNSQRPDMHFAAYSLSYGNLIPLREEMLTYTKPKQGIVSNKTIDISHVDTFPPSAGKKASLTYTSKSYGLPPNYPVTFDCVYASVRDAKLIAANLTGKAIDFQCDFVSRGKKFVKADYVYLQDYSLFLETASETLKGALVYPQHATTVIKKMEIVP